MTPTYIYTSSAISTQDSFSGTTFLENLVSIEQSKDIKNPVYRDFIKPMLMRRMSKATKMAVACAFNCMKTLEVEQPEAIVTGTGLGALADTEKFLQVSTTTEKKILPPSAFIQSGHNTIAGQIALLLKNDLYNMTHVQREFSFEYALLDAMLNTAEGKDNVLVGAYEELTPKIEDLADRFGMAHEIKNQLSEGAEFFMVGPNKAKAIAEVKAVEVIEFDNLPVAVSEFLQKNNIQLSQVLKGFTGFNLQEKTEVNLPFETLCYTDYCGRFFTSSAFGLHFATAYLQAKGTSGEVALVINFATPNTCSLTLLQRV